MFKKYSHAYVLLVVLLFFAVIIAPSASDVNQQITDNADNTVLSANEVTADAISAN